VTATERVARAAQRANLAARALAGAGDDLRAAALDGAADACQQSAEHVAGLADGIERLGEAA